MNLGVRLRVLNWNIDSGGRTEMITKIVEVTLSERPDVVVFPEYRKDKPRDQNAAAFVRFCGAYSS